MPEVDAKVENVTSVMLEDHELSEVEQRQVQVWVEEKIWYIF